MQKNPTTIGLLLFLLISYVSVLQADDGFVLSTGAYPTWDQQGGDYVVPELTLHSGVLSESVLDVAAARWEGGCLPTAMAMVMMYWEKKGMQDLLPGNVGFRFDSAINISQIASTGYFNDYYYPKDTSGNIIADRSANNPSTWRSDDCIADVLRTSRSRMALAAGATSSNAPGLYIKDWVEAKNSGYSVTVKTVGYFGRNNDLWPSIVNEIDASRPLIAYVNSTRGSHTIDHAVVVVGYGEDSSSKYYYALNTWDHQVHRYQYGNSNEREQWGIGQLITFDFSEQAPQANIIKFYNPASGAYFFSANAGEVAAIRSSNPAWRYIGAAFQVETQQAFNNVPVYRFYNFNSQSHFYTANPDECDTVKRTLSHAFRYEGVAFYVRTQQTEGNLPVYRFFLPRTSSHYFSISEQEKNQIIANGNPSEIRYEGVAWFSQPKH